MRKSKDRKKKQDKRTFYLWVDLEMTGLDPSTDEILEMAMVVTDTDLKRHEPSIECFHEYIMPKQAYDEEEEEFTRKKLIGCMSEWCQIHLVENGLVDKLMDGNSVPLYQAENRAILYMAHMFELPVRLLSHGKSDKMKEWLHERFTFHLAGNSVHCDLSFLRRHMPYFADLLHYRILDVSTIKLLCQNWNPVVWQGRPAKKTLHRAEDDIEESLEELRYYRSELFVNNFYISI